MFSAAMRGLPIDVQGAADVGCAIVDRVAEDGLSAWLDTVRAHHEGTYQHCLLVAGVTADFGLSLRFGAQDMERLGLAAMLQPGLDRLTSLYPFIPAQTELACARRRFNFPLASMAMPVGAEVSSKICFSVHLPADCSTTH